MYLTRTFPLFWVVLLSLVQAAAQSNSPVQWQFEVTQVSPGEVELSATAAMTPNWVIYSQYTPEGGPEPTQFTINGTFVKFQERSKTIREFDELFELEVVKFKNTAVFTYRLPITPDRRIKGTVDYMTCDGSRCLPPKEVPFEKVY